MTALSRFLRGMLNYHGAMVGQCFLCGQPANMGIRCQSCRDAARFDRFLHSLPVITQGKAVGRSEHPKPTQEELDRIPF